METETKPGGSMHSIFHSQLQSIASREEVHECPYAIYAPLVDVIASQYNRAVWSYRGPVKSMEEVRISHPPTFAPPLTPLSPR